MAEELSYFSESAQIERWRTITEMVNTGHDYQQFLLDAGNECASTDRMCEKLVDLAKKLEKNLALPKD